MISQVKFGWPGRQAYVRLHRWCGLTIALFIVISSLTGAALAFRDELEVMLAPQLQLVEAAPGAVFMSPYVLREKVQSQLGAGVFVPTLKLHPLPGRALMLGAFATGPVPLAYNQVFVNPYDGTVLGKRHSEAISLRPANLVPFLFKLHHSLAMPGVWGTLVLGIVAVIWTLDCFVGFYLTLPPKRPWLPKWGRAWQVRFDAWYKTNFDLHRAAGLWLWVVLLLFAWSSVMLTLTSQVYEPVMSSVFSFDKSWRGQALLPQPLRQMPLSWPEAHQLARQRMAEFAAERGLTVDVEEQFSFDPRRGLYMYLVHSDADLRSGVGNTGLLLDARPGLNGAVRGHWLPTRDQAGNTVSNWLGALHMGHVWGLPYRIFIALIGLVATMLSFTGTVIWWKKRKGRVSARLVRSQHR